MDKMLYEWFEDMWPLVGTVAIANFAHFFKPSEAYLVDILENNFHVSRETVLHDVFPWASYAMLPMTLLIGASLQWFGFSATFLAICVCGTLSTLCIIVSNGVFPWLVSSEVLYAAGFGIIFVSSAGVLSRIPERMYQRATSFIRSSMLLGTILSSIMGQIVDSNNGWGKGVGLVWMSLVGGGVSVVVAVVGWGAGVFRARGGEVVEFRQAWLDGWSVVVQSLRKPDVGSMCFTYSLFLAIHTLVITFWQLLIADKDQDLPNGGILAGAYVSAVATTSLPAILETRIAPYRHIIVPIIIALCAGLLFTMHWSPYGTLTAGALVAYHACAEALLAIVLTAIASRIHPPASTDQESELLTPASSSISSPTSSSTQPPSKHHSPIHLGPVWTLNFFAAMSLQIILQAITQACDLKATAQFLIYGCILAFLTLAAIAFGIFCPIPQPTFISHPSEEEDVGMEVN